MLHGSVYMDYIEEGNKIRETHIQTRTRSLSWPREAIVMFMMFLNVHADAIILQTRRSWYYCLFSVLEYQSMSHGSANMDYIK